VTPTEIPAIMARGAIVKEREKVETPD